MARKLTLEQKIEKEIMSELPQLAQLVADEEGSHGHPLKNPKARAEKIEHEIQHDFKVYKQRCKEGMLLCVKAVSDLATHDHHINAKDLKADLLKAFAVFDSVETAKNLGKQVIEGKTWKELLHLKDSSFEMLYKGARSIFDAGNFEQAEEAFFVLSLLDSKNSLFWIGLGHSAFHAHHHDVALKAYMAASMTDPHSIWPHIYAANCFEAKKDFRHALMALEEAKVIYNHNPHKKNIEIGNELNNRINELKHKA